MSKIISVSGLTKKYKGAHFNAVDDISFDVDEGNIFAFLGPNGAGKSTTIKILTTLLAPTSGEVIVAENNVVLDPDKVRTSFGIIFQDPSLDTELTAYENMVIHAIMYHIPKSIYKVRIQELLVLVDLWDKKEEFVKNFSGGMKRRLEIARGIIHHPRILFLDEPTVGLDPQTRNSMWEYLHNLNDKENITIFFTTHYLEEAEKNAKHITIIDHGKIIASGTSASLMIETETASLEDAFLKLTGKQIREEDAGTSDMIKRAGLWHK